VSKKDLTKKLQLSKVATISRPLKGRRNSTRLRQQCDRKCFGRPDKVFQNSPTFAQILPAWKDLLFNKNEVLKRIHKNDTKRKKYLFQMSKSSTQPDRNFKILSGQRECLCNRISGFKSRPDFQWYD
jgi:hypothetical protein